MRIRNFNCFSYAYNECLRENTSEVDNCLRSSLDNPNVLFMLAKCWDKGGSIIWKLPVKGILVDQVCAIVLMSHSAACEIVVNDKGDSVVVIIDERLASGRIIRSWGYAVICWKKQTWDLCVFKGAL